MFDPKGYFFEYSENCGWLSGGTWADPKQFFNDAVKKGHIWQIIFKEDN